MEMQILRKTNWKGLENAKKINRGDIIKTVKDSGLKGRSGSGFPTGTKWEAVFSAKGEKYLVCNADEGEPGNFKDRFIIEKNPQLLIEGIAIASYAMDIHNAFIYLRGEYAYLEESLKSQIKKSSGRLREIRLDIRIVLGAGAYICGEESAILESIEGNRPVVRKKPPYPAQVGLYGKPTCINNVETLASVPLIFTGNWDKDIVLFSLSGDVKNPGVYEFRLGTSLEKILFVSKPSPSPKAVYLGASGGCLPYKQFKNLPVDDKSFSENGAMLGSRGLIIVGEGRNMVEISKVFAEFFVHESCGYCTPCREGTFRILELLKRLREGEGTMEDYLLLTKLAPHIRDTSYCALGRSSTAHLMGAMKYFEDEFIKLCK
jgi:NADH:ubiquinone oxidoreductase subunit F (NADH-binding)